MIKIYKLVGYDDNAIAAMGVAMKVAMIVVMLQMGLTTGILPILAYNYGAHNFNRMKEIIKKIRHCMFGFGDCINNSLFYCLYTYCFSFVTGAEVIALGTAMTKAVIMSGPFIGLYFLCISVMQALEKSAQPIIISLLRQGIVYVPLMYILNYFFKLDGLIYTQTVSDYIAIFIALISCFAIWKNLLSNQQEKNSLL